MASRNSRADSSVGRAAALQAAGRRFEPCSAHQPNHPDIAGSAWTAQALMRRPLIGETDSLALGQDCETEPPHTGD